ncbi:MAG: type I-E CRISPR-associated endoribonuclease Cas2e [Acidimicrobiales bacterium]|jgi:CRISPR-associated protein Cas2
MTVIVLAVCPPGLRGHLTRWLLEVAPGVYVGRVTARVRDHLWGRISRHLGEDGRALMVYAARNEQGLDIRITVGPWQPVDLDGVKLIRRSLT